MRGLCPGACSLAPALRRRAAGPGRQRLLAPPRIVRFERLSAAPPARAARRAVRLGAGCSIGTQRAGCAGGGTRACSVRARAVAARAPPLPCNAGPRRALLPAPARGPTWSHQNLTLPGRWYTADTICGRSGGGGGDACCQAGARRARPMRAAPRTPQHKGAQGALPHSPPAELETGQGGVVTADSVPLHRAAPGWEVRWFLPALAGLCPKPLVSEGLYPTAHEVLSRALETLDCNRRLRVPTRLATRRCFRSRCWRDPGPGAGGWTPTTAR